MVQPRRPDGPEKRDDGEKKYSVPFAVLPLFRNGFPLYSTSLLPPARFPLSEG